MAWQPSAMSRRSGCRDTGEGRRYDMFKSESTYVVLVHSVGAASTVFLIDEGPQVTTKDGKSNKQTRVCPCLHGPHVRHLPGSPAGYMYILYVYTLVNLLYGTLLTPLVPTWAATPLFPLIGSYIHRDNTRYQEYLPQRCARC